MDSVLPRYWPGELFSGFDLPNANAIVAGLSDQPITLRGTDHPTYATAVADAWAKPDAYATAVEADSSLLVPDWLEKFLEKAKWIGGGITLAVVLVAIGALYVVKGD